MPSTRLVAHRGHPAAFPENSLPGLRAALEAGACHVEFDVNFSRDGVPFVLHDVNLRRATGVNVRIDALDSADVLALPAGEPSRFGEQFRQLRIPMLSEVLELLDGFPAVTGFVEVKRASLLKLGRDAAMHALTPLIAPRRERAVLLSFDHGLVGRAGAAGWRTGWAFEPWRAHHLARAQRLQPEFLFTSFIGLPPGSEAFWPGPWKWAVYDVPDLATAHWLFSLGAQLVETDWIVEWLAGSRERTA